jgi:hypothetical protein
MAARRSLLCYRLTAPWHVFVLRPQSVTISRRHPAVTEPEVCVILHSIRSMSANQRWPNQHATTVTMRFLMTRGYFEKRPGCRLHPAGSNRFNLNVISVHDVQ